MANEFRLSVAVPIHNEESLLPELLARLTSALDAIPGGPHEMIIVDDGSTDHTFVILEQAARQDPRVLALSLSRNFGHQSAISAALDHVTGDATVVMDGDLQDSPEAIPQFLERFQQGFDVVYAQRVRRKEPWPAAALLFHVLPLDGQPFRYPPSAGRRRFRVDVAKSRRGSAPHAGAPPLPSWHAKLGGIPPGGHSRRARLPLVPTVAVHKLWLMGKHTENEIISAGFDSRSDSINKLMGWLSQLEWLPQKFLGTSLMAVFARAKSGASTSQ